MIGIIGAMQLEVETLIAKMEDDAVRTVSGREFHVGRLCGQDVVAVQCGIGKVNAAMCAEAMILEFAPSLIVNVGVAGSLSGELSIGDIAVARDLIQYDVDTSAIGDPIGLVSTVNRIDFPCADWAAKAILDAAAQCGGIRARLARIATGDKFVADTQTKKWIHETFGADACEMEGCPIAQVCYINGVDCAVIRAISDSSDGDHAMEYDQFCRMAAENSAKVVEGFLRGLNT